MRGCPNELRAPTEITAIRGLTACSKSGMLEVAPPTLDSIHVG